MVAEDLTTGAVQNIIKGSVGLMDALVFWGMITFIAILVGGTFFFFIYKGTFKHTLIKRKLTNDRKIIEKVMFREMVGGVMPMWQVYKGLFSRPEKIPRAPPEALEITPNGKMFVEAYWTQEIGYQYIQDKGISKYDTDALKDSFKALSTNQRLLYMNEIKEIQARKGEGGFWEKHGMTLVAVSAVVMILILLMVFWGSITEPTLEAAKINNENSLHISEALANIDSLCGDKQRINPENINPEKRNNNISVVPN